MQTKTPTRGRPPLPEDEKASSKIYIRTSRKRKGAYVKAARADDGSKLTAWMLKHLDRAAGFVEVSDDAITISSLEHPELIQIMPKITREIEHDTREREIIEKRIEKNRGLLAAIRKSLGVVLLVFSSTLPYF